MAKKEATMASPSESNESTMISKLLPIRLTSCVIKGFGRGSKDLGIPTANVCKEKLKCKISFESLPCGIYWGYARIIEKTKEGSEDTSSSESESKSKSSMSSSEYTSVVYKTAVSIGYNPVYGNKDKTIEPHLIASSEHPLRKSSKCGETQFQDFYGSEIRLSIIGYLRPELPFEGLDKLIDAIKNDIVQTEMLAGGNDTIAIAERDWVETNIEG